ncbi:hypothetical protein FQA39_LY18623 [Lamprigera yunnana]|nr:hypothetical protein FQA39_LY18623 [Lamprigera yunnana]
MDSETDRGTDKAVVNGRLGDCAECAGIIKVSGKERTGSIAEGVCERDWNQAGREMTGEQCRGEWLGATVRMDVEKGRTELTVLLGASVQVEENSRESMRGSGFASNALLQNIGAAQTKTIADQVTTQYRYAAVFGRVNYNIKTGIYLMLLEDVTEVAAWGKPGRWHPLERWAEHGCFSEEAFLKIVHG